MAKWNRYVERYVEEPYDEEKVPLALRSLRECIVSNLFPRGVRNLLMTVDAPIRQRLVNSQKNRGCLHDIIRSQRLGDVIFVVETVGADVNLPATEYIDAPQICSPIDVAVDIENIMILNYLLKKEAHCKWFIHLLIHKKSVNEKWLKVIDKDKIKATLEYRHPLTGETPLLCAVMKDSYPWADALVQRGAIFATESGLDAVILATLFDRTNLLAYFNRVGYDQSPTRQIETLEIQGVCYVLNKREPGAFDRGMKYFKNALKMRRRYNSPRPNWLSSQEVFQQIRIFENEDELLTLRESHMIGRADLIIQCLLLVEQITGDYKQIIGEGILNSGGVLESLKHAQDAVAVITYFAGGSSLLNLSSTRVTGIFKKVHSKPKIRDVAHLILKFLQGGEYTVQNRNVTDYTLLMWSLIEKSEETNDVKEQLETLGGDGLLHACLMYAAVARRYRHSTFPATDLYRDDLISSLLDKGTFLGLPGYAATGSALWRACDVASDSLCERIKEAACCSLDRRAQDVRTKVSPLRCLAAQVVYDCKIQLAEKHRLEMIGADKSLKIPMEAFVTSHRRMPAPMDRKYHSRSPDSSHGSPAMGAYGANPQ